jgi:hypothetical protein
MKLLNLLLSDNRFKLKSILHSELHPQTTIIVPVHNSGDIIFYHLNMIINNAKDPIELIIINDASSDRSHKQIMLFMKCIALNNRHSIKYYATRIPMFESRCDDFGIRTASCEYVIEIQADMLIHEVGFDSKLKKLLELNPKIEMLSCRGVSDFDLLQNNKRKVNYGEVYDSILYSFFRLLRLHILYKYLKSNLKISRLVRLKNTLIELDASKEISASLMMKNTFPDIKSGVAGWLNEKINYLPYQYNLFFHQSLNALNDKIWVGQTCMRGPIILKKSTYIKLGGFNLKAFFQGLDEHDYALRLKDIEKCVGFTPIYFAAPTWLGSARNNRRIIDNVWSKIHRRARVKNIKFSALDKYMSKKDF